MKYWLLILLLLFAGCSERSDAGSTVVVPQIEPTAVQPTADSGAAVVEGAPTLPPAENEPPQPTATARSIAAMVEGRPIFFDEYQARLSQFRNWYPSGTPDGSTLEAYTIDTMVTQRILEQFAAEKEIIVSDETIDNAINSSIEDAGGQEAYLVWLAQNNFTEATFRQQIYDETLGQAVVQYVTQSVPNTAEYVHARYIQVDDPEQAQTVLAELQAGADFATLVELYSIEPSKGTTKGDLGYFRRGKLLVKPVEDTAFALQPQQISDVVAHQRSDGSTTYFIVQTLDRDPERKLMAGDYAELLGATFESWLADRRAAADITITTSQ